MYYELANADSKPPSCCENPAPFLALYFHGKKKFHLLWVSFPACVDRIFIYIACLRNSTQPVVAKLFIDEQKEEDDNSFIKQNFPRYQICFSITNGYFC